MKLNNIVITESDRIHRQEKFARENFTGLKQMGKELFDAIKTIKSMIVDAEKVKKQNPDSYYDEIQKMKKYSEQLSNLFLVLSIKLTTSFGHALNGKSTKTLKDIIRFLDKYGLGDKLFYNNMRSIVQSRSIHSDNILTLSSLIAAQLDDIDFIKELEAFAEKNKSRKNIYEDFDYTVSTYGDFGFSMQRIDEKNRIAFEALINGSEKVYRYLSGNDGLSPDYILKYITNKDGFWKRERLNSDESANLIKLEPKFIEDIITHMPENLPQYLIDIFVF